MYLLRPRVVWVVAKYPARPKVDFAGGGGPRTARRLAQGLRNAKNHIQARDKTPPCATYHPMTLVVCEHHQPAKSARAGVELPFRPAASVDFRTLAQVRPLSRRWDAVNQQML